MATCDRIGAPEIVTDGRAGHFANRECVAQLQGDVRAAVVPERLAVRCNEIHGHVECDRADCLPERAPERGVEPRGSSHRSGVWRQRRKELVAQLGFEGIRTESQQLHRVTFAAWTNLDQRRIDTVERRSAHQSDGKHSIIAS